MSDRKAVIKNADMAEDMQQDAVDSATHALEKFNIEKDIAASIKKEFDKKYNPTWHCIMSERKAVIKNADMAEDMQQDAVDCATQALEKYCDNIEKDIQCRLH
nr:hypothetical protein BaRGS_035158 [Batillaria attramentaria]